MTKVPVLPNIITAFALTCGLFMIFRMNMAPVGGVDLHILTVTAGILLLAALADLMDGAVARILRAESSFGGFFDSLADGITFGVGPSVIVLKTMSLEPGSGLSFLMTMAAMVYSVCGILRLVRFNVMSLQAKENPDPLENPKKHFTGLPIPAAAVSIVSLNLFFLSDEWKWLGISLDPYRFWILFTAMLLIGYFMVSRWKFPSLKTLHIRVSSFQKVLFTVIAAVFLFYGILNFFPLTFLIVSWGYVLIAATLSVARVIAGRRAKALEDFEPEPEPEDEN
jgi:CDP-diacylglycerol--serine O-phosphatidyltransferase